MKLIAVVVVAIGVAASAQESGKTVADGIFTDAQAARGASAYETSCAGCHRADLGGATGPALRDQRFARQFAGKDLKTLFTKVATTMPRNAPASLGDNVNLDIVAHVLKENGFPAGTHELTADALDGIRVLPGRPRPPPPIGDFSYVEVVGCLTAEPAAPKRESAKAEPASPKRARKYARVGGCYTDRTPCENFHKGTKPDAHAASGPDGLREGAHLRAPAAPREIPRVV
jgi:mono/diheme cytochrome c family protein